VTQVSARSSEFQLASISSIAPIPVTSDLGCTLEDRLGQIGLREMRASFDPKAGLLHCRFAFRGRPSFTPALIADIDRIQDLAAAYQADDGVGNPIRYICWASDEPGIWSAGGDLELFSELIRSRDRARLMAYARSVISAGYRNHLALELPMVTVALVQGQALGGGFEAALSSNILIAERRARFGLPESLFNLFPGMGAYSYLARRIAPALAERMILSGRLYTAEELYELGVVDVLCGDGEGERALYGFMARTEQAHAMQRAVLAARRRINPISIEELETIAEDWVDLAMGLGQRDLSIMARLVSAQNRRRTQADGANLA
jgi:DSF synthase